MIMPFYRDTLMSRKSMRCELELLDVDLMLGGWAECY